MKKLHLCFVLDICLLVASQKTALDTPDNLRLYREIRNLIFRVFGNAEGQERKFLANREQKIQEEIPPNVPFPCNVTGGRSSEVPDSVHRLRPGDIDVIAAMGDSLTAGNGIFSTNLLQVVIENRGVTASIGGEGNWRTYLTLPNILKEFNPNLIGYAQGTSQTSHRNSQLNVAEPGAMSRDMPFMAKYLINRMKNDPRINVEKQWKLISLMIGSNDFCTNLCELPSPWSILEDHKIDLINTLRILRDNLPRTFVILALPPHLKALVDTREGRDSFKCYTITTFECPCLFALQFRNQKSNYYDVIRRWQELEEEIADYSEFHTKDFTVEALPVLKYSNIPLADDGFSDVSYLAFDCFHVSQKANALYANGLWNNLLEPYGNKTEHWTTPYERFLCPTTKKPFLMTRENSRRNNKLR
ncbi:phospholipase B1, membrane-associated-like [Colletes gigas]|uniref:phospholipase B1, membrane-associated-like n=1 Tax=Colletes gigas TaxID=935657 RepID=UPI001C9A45D4|nr:phospholipase B1, membrane-associated-like [Colletes gigas]